MVLVLANDEEFFPTAEKLDDQKIMYTYTYITVGYEEESILHKCSSVPE